MPSPNPLVELDPQDLRLAAVTLQTLRDNLAVEAPRVAAWLDGQLLLLLIEARRQESLLARVGLELGTRA